MMGCEFVFVCRGSEGEGRCFFGRVCPDSLDSRDSSQKKCPALGIEPRSTLLGTPRVCLPLYTTRDTEDENITLQLFQIVQSQCFVAVFSKAHRRARGKIHPQGIMFVLAVSVDGATQILVAQPNFSPQHLQHVGIAIVPHHKDVGTSSQVGGDGEGILGGQHAADVFVGAGIAK